MLQYLVQKESVPVPLYICLTVSSMIHQYIRSYYILIELCNQLTIFLMLVAVGDWTLALMLLIKSTITLGTIGGGIEP